MGSGCNRHHKYALSTRNFGYALHSTEGLFVMAVTLTSHWNFLTLLTFLESFYMVLDNKKKNLKKSEHFLFFHLYYIRVKFKTAGSFMPLDLEKI